MTARMKWVRGALIATLVMGIGACGGSSSPPVVSPPLAQNPTPSLSTLSPTNTALGGADFVLTVGGSNFVTGSVVKWNGSSRATAFVTSSQLNATISKADIANASTAAVSVFNPQPGGGTSQSLTFAIEPGTAELWQVTDLAFNAQAGYTNPFTDETVTCEFDGPSGERLTITGFYDGNGVWRVRFAPTVVGTWSYRTTSSNAKDLGLHAVSGQLPVTSGSSANPLYVHGGFLHLSSTGRFLTYTDGTPFFWLGDTWWFSPSSLMPIDSDPGFKPLVDKRKEQQFSVIQMAFQGPDLGPMISSAQARNLDVSFWQNVDRYFSYANENGLLPAVGLSFGGLEGGTQGTLDDWKFLWSYFISRYGSHAVLWIICGEYNVFNKPDQVDQVLILGQFIKDNDPYKRATSVHPWQYSVDQHQAWGQTWYDFVMIQGGHVAPPWVPSSDAYSVPYAISPPKPVLEAECDYEGIFGGTANEIPPSQVRRVAYRAVQMGSFGYTYGSHGLWYPTQSTDDQTMWSDWGTSPPYWEAVNRPGATHMQILRNLYESVEWWNLEPRSEALIFKGTTTPDDPYQPTAKAYADDSLYVLYFPQNADPKAAYDLLLRTTDQLSFKAKWVDPQTGTSTSLSSPLSAVAGSCALPSRPSSEDWVLVLTKI